MIFARRWYQVFGAGLVLSFLALFICLQRYLMLGNGIKDSSFSKVFETSFSFERHHFDYNSIDSLPNEQLLDMNYFKFLKNNSHICTKHKSVYLLAFVHSSSSNFEKRQVIRKTWASKLIQKSLKFKVIFLIGKPQNLTLQTFLDQENDKYHDIVQGNFIDSYKNLTYKHLMGYKWILKFCRSATFIMKVDDDAYIDIFKVISTHLKAFDTQIQKPKNILSCSLFPEGSLVKREGKWQLSYQDYPFDTFPAYCSGIAYFTTLDVIKDLYFASFQVKPFIWIDDLFITGILASTYSIRHQPINYKFTYNSNDLRNWLLKTNLNPSPYMIGDIGEVIDWKDLMIKLWSKTFKSWKQTV